MGLDSPDCVRAGPCQPRPAWESTRCSRAAVSGAQQQRPHQWQQSSFSLGSSCIFLAGLDQFLLRLSLLRLLWSFSIISSSLSSSLRSLLSLSLRRLNRLLLSQPDQGKGERTIFIIEVNSKKRDYIICDTR